MRDVSHLLLRYVEEVEHAVVAHHSQPAIPRQGLQAHAKQGAFFPGETLEDAIEREHCGPPEQQRRQA